MCDCVYKEVWAEYVDLVCMWHGALGWRHGGNSSVKIAFESQAGDKPHWLYNVVIRCRICIQHMFSLHIQYKCLGHTCLCDYVPAIFIFFLDVFVFSMVGVVMCIYDSLSQSSLSQKS